jgi:hypothetical protein
MTRPLPLLISLLLLLPALFIAVEASAEDRQIARVSASQLKSACDKAGGSFIGPTPNNGAYNCLKENCDGKGGYCQVNCQPNDSTCTGTTPMQLGGNQTLLSILQNGDMVFRQYDPVTTAGTGGSDDSGTTDPGGGGGLPCEPIC